MSTSVITRLAAALLVALILVPDRASIARDNAIYTVSGVAVDETAESAAAARDIALTKGQAAAFRRLIDRIVPLADQPRVPSLTASARVELVAGIDVEGEKTSPVRYLATLSVRFNQSAVRDMLRSNGIQFAETPGKPLVVLPVYRVGGTLQLWDASNVWLAAWKSLPPMDALLPLVVPPGNAADLADISPSQALNGEEGRLRAIASRYAAAGVVMAVATLRPDDAARVNVVEVAVSRFGAQAGDSVSVRSFSGTPDTTVEALLRSAAQSVRTDVIESWKRENLLRFGERREIVAVVPLSGLADWVALREKIGGVASVERFQLVALSLREAAVRLSYFWDENQLVLAFAQRDMELKKDSVDWRLRSVAGGAKTETGSADTR